MASIAKITKRSTVLGEAVRTVASPRAWVRGTRSAFGMLFRLNGDRAIHVMDSLDALTNNELQTAPLIANFKNAFLTGAKSLFLPFANRTENGLADTLGNLNRTLQEQQIGRTPPIAPLHYDSGLNR